MSLCLRFLLTRPGGKGEGQRADTLGFLGSHLGKEIRGGGRRLPIEKVVSVGLQESFRK